ncbi:MAG: cytochrome P450 [Bacteroidota bacterium]
MKTTYQPSEIPQLKQRFPGEVLLRFRRNPLTVLEEMAGMGDVSTLRLLNFRFFMINDPVLIKEILVTQQDAFIKGRPVQFLGYLLGKGLLNSEGAFHRQQRKLVLPAFHHHKIKAYAEAMATCAERMNQNWQSGTVLNMGEEMMALTLEVVGRTLFGSDVSGEAEEIGEVLSEAQEMFKNIANPLAEIILKFPFPATKRIERIVARMDATIYRLIEEHRSAPERYTDLLSMLLAAQDEETGEGMSDEQVRDEAMTLFTAGHETTAIAMMWTWFLLSQNPKAEQKLHAELDRVLNGRIPTFDDLPALPYTRQVFSESLRLYPPAWAVTREAKRDLHLGSYFIPQGAALDFCPFILHRDARFWPDPLRFDPDRFAPDKKKSIDKFTYLPFSLGVRGCVGEQFAWTEGIILLATIAQKWRFELCSDPNPELRPIVTLHPAKPVKMRVLKR